MPTAAPVAWPEKTRDIHNHHFDSTCWDDFPFRDDDIIIATYAKAGTTWTQQIVGQLVFGGVDDIPVADLSPWIDLRVPPKPVKLEVVEAQKHRRFLKTHLPVDALVFSPKAKYLYIARDGRDIVWSMYNHHARANAEWYQALNETPGRVGPPIERPGDSVREYFLEWLDRDGHPFWPFWENVRSWWAIRSLPNVMLLHYADLKQDLDGEIRRIADFLDIDLPAERLPEISRRCTFDYMKQNAASCVPLGGVFWDGGATTFLHKGTNGRWRDELTPEDVARYEATAREQLGEDCARWLAFGGPPFPA